MKKLIILSLLLTTFINPSFAILEEDKIDLKNAIDLALKTNPQIKIKELDTKTAANNVKISSKLQNPNIGAIQNFAKLDEQDPQHFGADYTFEILKRGKRKELAKSNLVSIEYDKKFTQNELIFEVKKAYIDFLLKKSNLKIIEEQQELSKEILDNINKDFVNKKIASNEVIQAKIALNRSIMYSNIARSQLISAQNHFNSVMNTSEINYDVKEDCLTDDYASLLTIAPYDNSINFEKIKTYALMNRFDLLKAKQDMKSADENLKVTKSQLIPDIEIGGGYGYQRASKAPDGKFLSGAYASVSLINIPLIHQYKPEIQNAKLEIEKAKLKYQDVEIDAIRNITDAWEKFSIAKDNLNFYNKELLANSKELMDASKKSLDKKEIDITAFLVSKKLYLELMLGYQEALAEYYISYAELAREINLPYFGNFNSLGENL